MLLGKPLNLDKRFPVRLDLNNYYIVGLVDCSVQSQVPEYQSSLDVDRGSLHKYDSKIN